MSCLSTVTSISRLTPVLLPRTGVYRSPAASTTELLLVRATAQSISFQQVICAQRDGGISNGITLRTLRSRLSKCHTSQIDSVLAAGQILAILWTYWEGVR